MPRLWFLCGLTLQFLAAQVGLTRVSGSSPFATGCAGATGGGVNYTNAEVETFVAVDPNDFRHLIGAWQQDRWSNGGSGGLLTAVSRNGGVTWSATQIPFSHCTGGNSQNGGDYERATDPWVTIGVDSKAFAISYSFNESNSRQAMLVSRSQDGGVNWENPLPLILDTAAGVADDKESITADSRRPGYVYAVWDRLTGLDSNQSANFRGPAWFARTTNSGDTWEPARIIYDPGANAQTIGNQISVLPDGTLVDVFALIFNAAAPLLTQERIAIAIVRSLDAGVTWSGPVIVAAGESVGVSDVKTNQPVRTAAVLPAIAADPKTAAVYVTWQDARFSGGARDGIALSSSADGGQTWSVPLQVNQAPNVQAFNPAVAVGQDGTIAVTYYDFRNDTADASVLLTNYWRVASIDHGKSWSEIPLAGPFDLTTAPVTQGEGYFIGDYAGLHALPCRVPDEGRSREAFIQHGSFPVPACGPDGAEFLSFMTLTNSGNFANRTDVFTTSTASGRSAGLGNGHVEIHRYPTRRRENMETRPTPNRRRRAKQ